MRLQCDRFGREYRAALLVIGLATTSWAQNGLERFEKELKPQLELKKFTYAQRRSRSATRASS